jgi:hypothetical protein
MRLGLDLIKKGSEYGTSSDEARCVLVFLLQLISL